MKKNRNLNDRIIDLLGEGPLVALYVTIAIDVLCQVVDKSDDEFVHALFGRMTPPLQQSVNAFTKWIANSIPKRKFKMSNHDTP